MTTTNTAFIFQPRAPHADSLADPRLTIRDASGTLLLHFCPKNRCAAVYDLQSRAWTMYSPMEPEQLIGALPNLGVKIADTAALQVWIDEISKEQPSARKH